MAKNTTTAEPPVWMTKIDPESEEYLRRALGIDDINEPMPEAVMKLHYRVKRMVDRLQLPPMSKNPHLLALIVVLADGDVQEE